MKNIKFLSVFILFFILCSCNEKVSNEKPKPDGFWKQIGYGNIIELNDTIISVYNISKQDCNLSFKEHILDFGKVTNYSKETLTIQHGNDDWLFTRLEKLPNLCKTTSELNNDPKINFQVFWDTFNEHYASFDIKDINWKEVYKKYKPKVNENTTDLELYTIFKEMIAILNDGHVKMEVPEKIENEYKNKIKEQEEKYSKLDEFNLNKEIAEFYVDSLRNYNAGMVRYGLIKKNVGYIQINSMLMLADYNLEKDLDLRNFYGQYWEKAENRKDELQRQDEVDGINKILNSIIKNLPQAKSYILDLRFNGGGKDAVALDILNHFSDKEKLAYTKKARIEKGFANPQKFKIIPSKNHFNGNVYLLTSNLTASASEILVLASLANSNFKRIGSTTEGIFSSTLDKELPNGWEYELSNEVYQDLKGKNYENVGISADYPLEYSTNKDEFLDQLTNDLKNKKDKAIELVIELEKEKSGK
ncbi:tricorn protease-like protein [Lutibacter sp. Hel_I_33_5]|uniref:S41 family peptidase n=1 Tax=Lutibacter sp. Hel_I_33_5 TaxID=1566289 RepID=UPI0011A1B7DA|nr:S41 family peptidase [Lutibacter sp. Hel_I_33_5]TVZ56920.1 tricorn protease-like protein [Lutibacter sp. Hel_I_33_5]